MSQPDLCPPQTAELTLRDTSDDAAGGLGALWSTARRVLAQAGLVHGARALTSANQADGFDCPGCAWPEPKHRSAFEFCENGAKAIAADATRARVTPDFFAQHSIASLLARSDQWLEAQGRLTTPMLRRAGADHYAPISWDEAFALLGDALRGLSDPNEAIFYTSGRTSNEAAFLYQLLARQLGTNNLPDCSNLCHESSGRGLGETLGVGKGTVSLEDFERADAIFVMGQNPGTNHPRMLTTLQQAARRGCAIVAVNPLRERALERFIHPQEVWNYPTRGTPIATEYLQVRINGDAALLKGMMKELLAEEARRPGEVLDHDFIARHTTGFEGFRAALDATSWDDCVEGSGLTKEQIQAAAHIYIKSKATIVCWAMGLTQHKEAVATIQEVVNLLLLRGNIGRPGAGACPVRGHSNVQGDRTMGIIERPSEDFLQRLEKTFAFSAPRAHGVDVVAAIEAMAEGRAKVFVAMGGNFHSASPDTAKTAAALRRCAWTVHVATRLNRSHLVTGAQALLLPCLSRHERDVQASGEQYVTVEDSMSEVHASRGRFAPCAPNLRGEVAIVAGLARAALPEPLRAGWVGIEDDYDRIRDKIEAVIPGFEGFNARAKEGFVLPNRARAREFRLEDQRAAFTAHPLPAQALAPGQYLLMTIRSHDQYNTTIYGQDDRYRGIKGDRRVVMINPEDLRAAGLRAEQRVTVRSHFRGEQREVHDFALIPYDIPRGCLAAYFPETNPLVPLGSIADKSHTPTSKSLTVTLHP